jgi:hypothetical protein
LGCSASAAPANIKVRTGLGSMPLGVQRLSSACHHQGAHRFRFHACLHLLQLDTLYTPNARETVKPPHYLQLQTGGATTHTFADLRHHQAPTRGEDDGEDTHSDEDD